MVVEAFKGRDARWEVSEMSFGEVEALAKRIVDFQLIARDNIKGVAGRFGWGTINGGGGFDSWWDVLQTFFDPSDISISTAASSERTRELSTRTVSKLLALRPKFDSVLPLCFLDDLTTKNVIVSEGKLTGVVDFDGVCFGDARLWLALTIVAFTSDVPNSPSAEHYVAELLHLSHERLGLDVKTGEGKEILDTYCCLFALQFLMRMEAEQDEEWTRRMWNCTDSWLATLKL